ncbi:MAG: M48 family metallopeptidase [Candidatus Nomurabacteria bacterium]|nr:M48 family metallopeptidase [Candidatus Nomurabacteria bacterium]
MFNKESSDKALATKNKILHDDEFGDIEIRRVRGMCMRIKIQPNGKMIAQLPRLIPLREVTKFLDQSRERLRQSLQSMPARKTYKNGDTIGKSHHLIIQEGEQENTRLKKLDIVVNITSKTTPSAQDRLVKDGIAKALREEAKAYLPRRLAFLADKHNFSYNQLRFMHAKSRWGSCSSRGTISLNIMLMTMPNELIDYVLLHELNHTKHMDHSKAFWSDLEKIYPDAKIHKKTLQKFSPYL